MSPNVCTDPSHGPFAHKHVGSLRWFYKPAHRIGALVDLFQIRHPKLVRFVFPDVPTNRKN